MSFTESIHLIYWTSTLSSTKMNECGHQVLYRPLLHSSFWLVPEAWENTLTLPALVSLGLRNRNKTGSVECSYENNTQKGAKCGWSLSGQCSRCGVLAFLSQTAHCQLVITIHSFGFPRHSSCLPAGDRCWADTGVSLVTIPAPPLPLISVLPWSSSHHSAPMAFDLHHYLF